MNAAGKRQDRLGRLIEDVRARTFPYVARPEQPIDWAAYSEAQVHEADDTLRLIRRGVDRVAEPPRPAGPGRPHEHSAKDLAKVVLMQQYLGASNRVAQGYAGLFREKLGLTRVPGYKTIERAYEDGRVDTVLEQVFALTQPDDVEGFTLDGSALPTSIKDNWESQKRAGGADAGRFDGSVTLLALPHQLVAAHITLRVGFTAESPALEPLVEKALRYRDALPGPFTGDAAFLSRRNCDVVAAAGGVPRFFPKRGITFKRLGSDAWVQMLGDFLRDPQAWLRQYHQRSLSETGWSTDKRRHGPLRRRVARCREAEKHARFTVGNLTRLGYLRRLGRLALPWTRIAGS